MQRAGVEAFLAGGRVHDRIEDVDRAAVRGDLRAGGQVEELLAVAVTGDGLLQPGLPAVCGAEQVGPKARPVLGVANRTSVTPLVVAGVAMGAPTWPILCQAFPPLVVLRRDRSFGLMALMAKTGGSWVPPSARHFPGSPGRS